MSDIQEIRRLLDERGIEYAESEDRFFTRFRLNYCESCSDYLEEIIVMGACITASKNYQTPEQAIATVLGNNIYDPDAREVFYNLQLTALYYIRATIAELCETTDESFGSRFAFSNGLAAIYERLFLEGAPATIGEATSRIDAITMKVNEIAKEKGW